MISYILPFSLYLAISQFSGEFPNIYPLYYGASVVTVGLVSFFMLRGKGIFKIHRHVMPGIAFGIVGIAAWIYISQLQLEQPIMQLLPTWLQPGDRVSFNPFLSIANPVGQWSFIAVRMFGLAILVPVVEEIFWRGFLMRWVISPKWHEQKIGIFTPKSFLWVVFLFTLAHPEWFAAAVYCALLNVLLYWKRDLFNCIIAHATSNLLLGFYIIYSGNWQLW
jgi:CAAX prenyl protease-like protein